MRKLSPRIAGAVLIALLFFAAPLALGQQRNAASLALPVEPRSFVVSPTTNTIYVLGVDSVLYSVDGRTMKIVDQLSINGGGNGQLRLDPLDAAGDVVWVFSPDSRGAIRVDPRARTQQFHFQDQRPVFGSVGRRGLWAIHHDAGDPEGDHGQAGLATDASTFRVIGEGARGSAINAKTQVLYTTGGHGLFVYNTDGNQTAEVDYDRKFPKGVVVNPVSGQVYATSERQFIQFGWPYNWNGDWLTVFRGTDGNNQIITRLNIPTSSVVHDLAVDSTANKTYFLGGSIFEVDGTNHTGRDLGHHGSELAINQTTNRIITNQSPGFVEIDPTGANPATLISSLDFPNFPIVNPITNRVYGFDTNPKVLVSGDATMALATTAVGSNGAGAVATDPYANETMVANRWLNSVSLVGGGVFPTSEVIAVNGSPAAIGVNSATRKWYVVNASPTFSSRGSVTIIDRRNNNARTDITIGHHPFAVAINPTTNKIYVLNAGAQFGFFNYPPSVSVIDGTTNTLTATVTGLGMGASAIAVDTTLNRIYVANFDSNDVSVISGDTNKVIRTVPVGRGPSAIAVNSEFGVNTAWVTCATDNTAVAIASNYVTSTVAVGTEPRLIAIMPLTRRVFVGNLGSKNATIIDHTSKSVLATVDLGGEAAHVAVDPASNRVFFTVSDANIHLAMIDGASLAVSRYPAGAAPFQVAVNPRTSMLYVSDAGNDQLKVMIQNTSTNPQPWTTVDALANDTTTDPSPLLTFRVRNDQRGLDVNEVYWQIDTFAGKWNRAPVTNGTATVELPVLPLGPHTVYFMSADGEIRTVEDTGNLNSPRTGALGSYMFFVTCGDSVMVTPANASFGPTAATGSFSVTTTCAYSINSTVSWIQPTLAYWGGNATIQYKVLANNGAARTGQIFITGNGSMQQTQVITVTQQASRVPHTDFNGDGMGDLIWRHYNGTFAVGENSVWHMNGTTIGSITVLQPDQNLQASIEGTGDFNGDGTPDIVWRNYNNGENTVWYMKPGNPAPFAIGQLPIQGDPNWKIDAIGDFNRDGKPDLAWRNYFDGQNAIWLMNNTTRLDAKLIPTTPLPWRLEGAGDFDQDGIFDLLFHEPNTGQNALWLMQDHTTYKPGGNIFIRTETNTALNIEAVTDMNGDGHADIVWRNYTSGANQVWFMNQTMFVSTSSLTTVTDLTYHMGGKGLNIR